MICKNVSRVIVKENSFSKYRRNFISTEKLSKLKLIMNVIKEYCFGWDKNYKEDMNKLELIKSKSHQYHSIL